MLEMICRAAENGGGSSPRASLSPSEERRLNLFPLGWDERFEERLVLEPGDAPARVAAVDREQPLLIDQNGAFFVPTRRKLSVQVPPLARAAARRRLGVCVEKRPGDDFGVVHALLERRTELRRKSAGETVDRQMIAANVDRLERYLVMIRDGGAEPRVPLTKTDLVEPGVPEADPRGGDRCSRPHPLQRRAGRGGRVDRDA